MRWSYTSGAAAQYIRGIELALLHQRVEREHNRIRIEHAWVISVLIEIDISPAHNHKRLRQLGIVGGNREPMRGAPGLEQIAARGLGLVRILKIVPATGDGSEVDEAPHAILWIEKERLHTDAGHDRVAVDRLIRRIERQEFLLSMNQKGKRYREFPYLVRGSVVFYEGEFAAARSASSRTSNALSTCLCRTRLRSYPR